MREFTYLVSPLQNTNFIIKSPHLLAQLPTRPLAPSPLAHSQYRPLAPSPFHPFALSIPSLYTLAFVLLDTIPPSSESYFDTLCTQYITRSIAPRYNSSFVGITRSIAPRYNSSFVGITRSIALALLV